VAIRADHVRNLLAIRPNSPLVLIRETAKAEGDRGRLHSVWLDAAVLLVEPVWVTWSSRPTI
jgi:hypothetical protein